MPPAWRRQVQKRTRARSVRASATPKTRTTRTSPRTASRPFVRPVKPLRADVLELATHDDAVEELPERVAGLARRGLGDLEVHAARVEKLGDAGRVLAVVGHVRLEERETPRVGDPVVLLEAVDLGLGDLGDLDLVGVERAEALTPVTTRDVVERLHRLARLRGPRGRAHLLGRPAETLGELHPEGRVIGPVDLLVGEVLDEDLPDRDLRAAAVHG